jgi:ribonucleoside-diphosphate reductase beta chain
MSLTQKREVYKPFEYPKAFEYFEKQQQAHWLPTEVSMAGDINDWKTVLNEVEKSVIGNVLKGFTQAEIHVEDYWSRKVAKWFVKPEVCMMANTFAGMEAIHIWGYSYLNDSLGLDDYAAFLKDDATMAKLNRLKDTKAIKTSKEEIARSLAVFSGFTEGVHLFSSFAILLNFSRFNKLKGVGQIVTWSIRDESLHSEAGCWLFREYCKENPGVRESIEEDVYEAARLTVKLEDDFIDMCFKSPTGDNSIDKMFNLGIEGLDRDDLKQYIRYRTNTKLQDLGYASNWKNIDKDAIKRMEWFDALSAGVEFQDFFAQRVTTYSKGVSSNWNTDYVFGDEDDKKN